MIKYCVPAEPVRILGIDDWAWKKGRTYGTILCDLERHIPSDLLPDREADTVVAWLLKHPSVEIVSRDRAGAYADAARRGVPQAMQVADRFHLIKNLGDALEPILDRNKTYLRFTDESSTTSGGEMQAPPSCSPALGEIRPAPIRKAEEARLAHRQERQERYEQIIALREQGFTIADTAHRLGVSRSTIDRFLAAPCFPEKKRRRAEQTKLNAYHSYLWEHWQAGVQNARHLFREITELGDTGSYASVYKYLTCLSTGVCLPATSVQPTVRTLTAKQAHFLFLRSPTDLQPEELQDLQIIVSRSSDLALAYHLGQSFVTMLAKRRAGDLDNWLKQAEQCHICELQRFANGIRRDYAAVKAAFSTEVNNGQVEGQVLRLKLQKRQVYGRAKFDLLRLRVLHHV